MYSWKAGTAMRNMITLEKRFIERVVKVAIKKKDFWRAVQNTNCIPRVLI